MKPKSLYIAGTSGSGKTATCLGLALKFQELGLKVSYFKPVGNVGGVAGREDEDAKLMKDVLNMEAALSEITLFDFSIRYLEKYNKNKSREYLNSIVNAYKDVSKGADVVILEGTTNPQAMISLNLDVTSIASKLNSKVLMVARVDNDLRMDGVLLYDEYMKKNVHLIGTIFNFVPKHIADKINNTYIPLMKKRGFNVLGVVPETTELTAPTVQEIYDILGGELLTGANRMHLLVENFLVGAMNVESAVNYFKKFADKAVITGGDRTDIALAALDTSTSVLILTGDLHPDIGVLTKADDKGVPVLLVPYDTYTTVEKLRETSRKIRPEDKKVQMLAKELVSKYCKWNVILKSLGVSLKG